ncbi:hypothetical protein [Lentisalinibacter salinarum]|uniref:hypothetical protein n=1 Tax=Lentisalinibacter salinarum TaxID=2992239 RepID=UPI00386AE203
MRKTYDTLHSLHWSRLVVVLASLLFVSACVSSPETKIASTQYKVALDDYARNLRLFERAWIAEIDALIDDLGSALAARAVAERIRILSADYDGFSSEDWEQEVARNGLITLSEAVASERARVESVLGRLESIGLPAGQDPQKVVTHVLNTYREQTIAALELQPDLDDAERARLLAEANLGPFGNDTVSNAMVKVIITSRLARNSIPRDLDNLEAVVSALKTTHASVDKWIQTDVTVPGEDVATLVSSWSDALRGSQ